MDLVFEIGTEELPASFQKPALEWMAAEINKALDDARLNGEGEGQRANIATFATPRRLAMIVTAIAEKAPDVRKKLSGPPAKQALQDGKWTKAAEGFARKAGVAVEALKIEGDRVIVEQQIRGQAAAEALPRILEQIVRGIPFRKSMRWDSLDADSFARPVHWIAAALDGKPLTVKFADVESAPKTRGHRFAAPQEFPLPSARDYVSALRQAHVLADWAERSQRIAAAVARAAREAGGVPRPDPELLETVTGLVEESFAVAGYFEKEFLQLPPEVLVSEMRGHQKYFAVQNEKGDLLPSFVAVSNTKVRDPNVSRRGYERVLRARLSDGKFFFDEDRKVPLRSRVEKLGRRTFLQGLGTELERIGRLRELSQTSDALQLGAESLQEGAPPQLLDAGAERHLAVFVEEEFSVGEARPQHALVTSAADVGVADLGVRHGDERGQKVAFLVLHREVLLVPAHLRDEDLRGELQEFLLEIPGDGEGLLDEAGDGLQQFGIGARNAARLARGASHRCGDALAPLGPVGEDVRLPQRGHVIARRGQGELLRRG